MIRIFSPMKSEVDFTCGFSFSIVATGTPVWEEITPKLSPARTVQKRLPAAPVLVWDEPLVVVVAPAGCEGADAVTVSDAGDGDPVWSPARTSTTAIVTAARNAAGAR